MTPMDDLLLRQKLRDEIGALPVSPAPVEAVARRGRAIRSRRRAAAAAVAAAAAAVAVIAALPSPPGRGGPAHGRGRPAQPPVPVTMAQVHAVGPDGVFASGTVGRATWRLALRDIAAPGQPCLPAVSWNGRYDDILWPGRATAAAPGYPAFLTLLPGLPGAGFGFVQVAPTVTKVSVLLRNGAQVITVPASIRLCGRRFHLAGFGFSGSPATSVTMYSPGGRLRSRQTSYVPFASDYPSPWIPYGLWENTGSYRSIDTLTQPVATGVVARGRVHAAPWTVTAQLGDSAGNCGSGGTSRAGGAIQVQSTCWSAECYALSVTPRAATTQPAGPFTTTDCTPIAPPPAAIALIRIPVMRPFPSMTVYAGVVNPRTQFVTVALSDGSTRKFLPVVVAGRPYVAIVVPAGPRVLRVTVVSTTDRVLGVMSAPPAACGVPMPSCSAAGPPAQAERG